MGPRLDELLTDDELRDVIARFYDSVYCDEVLGPLFENVHRPSQEVRLARFIRMTARSDADRLDGSFLRTAHARLQLTDALFERRRELLDAAIRDCGHGDDVRSAWERYDARWRTWVVGERTA